MPTSYFGLENNPAQRRASQPPTPSWAAMLVAREGESVCFKSGVSARLTMCRVCMYTWISVWMCLCHCTRMKVISLLPTLYWLWGLNSGLEAFGVGTFAHWAILAVQKSGFRRKTEVAELSTDICRLCRMCSLSGFWRAGCCAALSTRKCHFWYQWSYSLLSGFFCKAIKVYGNKLLYKWIWFQNSFSKMDSWLLFYFSFPSSEWIAGLTVPLDLWYVYWLEKDGASLTLWVLLLHSLQRDLRSVLSLLSTPLGGHLHPSSAPLLGAATTAPQLGRIPYGCCHS